MQQQVASPTFSTALASAVFEWFLIFLLFVDATFSYLITKFARYSRLPIPCLLCSRLDHVLGNERAGFYWNLFCNKHKLKLSSLVPCHLHQKLVDVHDLCESCLFSFATVNKSNAETYRLLLGKLGDEPHLGRGCDLSDGHASSTDGKLCSCCNEQLLPRNSVQILFDNKSTGNAELCTPLLATDGHDTVELKEITDVSSQNVRALSGTVYVDPLLHVRYQKVNITSDTESKASLSDDDSTCVATQLTMFGPEDSNAAGATEELSLIDDLTSDKMIDLTVANKPSSPKSNVLVKDGDLHCSESPKPIKNGLQELSCPQIEPKSGGSEHAEVSDIIYVSNTLPPSDAGLCSVDVSEETSEIKYVAELGKEAAKNGEALAEPASRITSSNERFLDLKSASDNGSQMSNMLELGDAYKLAVGSRGRQLSGKLLEQISLKDSARLSDDLKLLLSQLSSARGIDLPSSDVSPRISGNIAEYRTSDASNSTGMQILQKRISLDRNESGISLDGSTVSEIEGESLVDRLKRQVEHDRRIMNSLFKELEEERNASAVAVNQAMAMITRLQEEKSALQMEALQCIRMMEEQAEYDNEALQKANDLLTEKEKETQDLGFELEFYKNKPSNLCLAENMLAQKFKLDLQEQEACSEQSNTNVPDSERNIDSSCSKCDETTKLSGCQGINMKSLLPDLENETSHIMQRLRILERKLELFSSDEAFVDIPANDRPVDKNACSHAINNGESNKHPLQEPAILQKEINVVGEECTSQNASRKIEEIECGLECCQNMHLDDLRNEFLVLSGRLKALEAERNFLEQAIISLNKGDEGIKLIQDIAHQVRELLSIGFRKSYSYATG